MILSKVVWPSLWKKKKKNLEKPLGVWNWPTCRFKVKSVKLKTAVGVVENFVMLGTHIEKLKIKKTFLDGYPYNKQKLSLMCGKGYQ